MEGAARAWYRDEKKEERRWAGGRPRGAGGRPRLGMEEGSEAWRYAGEGWEARKAAMVADSSAVRVVLEKEKEGERLRCTAAARCAANSAL